MFMLITFATGVGGPAKQACLHRVIPSEQRASVISLDSMRDNAGGVVGPTGLGYLSRTLSISDAYVAGGVVAAGLMVPVPPLLRRLGEAADRLEGQGCGAPAAPSAGQGLPPIALVDAGTRRR